MENDSSFTRKFSISDDLPEIQNPFSLKSTFGFTKEIGIRLTLDKNDELIMIYCMSNIICLYDINQKTSKYITGHAYRIQQLLLSSDGRILISNDSKNLHIWDLKCSDENNAIILKIIKDPFEKHYEIAQVSLSPCSRYLILVSSLHEIQKDKNNDKFSSNDKVIKGYKVQFWDWSLDREICDDMLQINNDYGNLKHLIFDCNEGRENYFAITFEEKVVFGLITDDFKISIYITKMARPKYNNSLTRTIYIKNNTLAISSTSNGKVIVWNDDDDVKKNKNIKKLYKIITLKKSNLIEMITIDNYIVIIDNDGDIRFYDEDMKLIFICKSQEITLEKNLVLSICPNIYRRDFKIIGDNIIIQDENDEETIASCNKCPHKCTITREPFIIRPFFLVNEAGEIGLVDIIKKTYQIILIPTEDYYVIMDTYTQKSWMIGCTKNDCIIIRNYETNNIIAKYNFKPKNISMKNYRKILTKNVVTCVKVSENENFIALGYKNGNLWMMDPITAIETHELPMKFTNCAIRKIVFKKDDNNFCALADDNNTLIYIHFNGINWYMLATYKYHCMPIIGIFFLSHEQNNYLITIGFDGMYARYKNCHHNQTETQFLLAENDVRLNQEPNITASELLESKILENDTSISKYIIIAANSQCKFVFYDAYTAENLFTFLGPIYESPIQKIIFCPNRYGINEPPILLFATRKSIGAAILPLDGNPFRYSGKFAHHTQIITFKLNYNFTGVLMHGEGDSGPTYWDINRDNMNKKFDFGGKGLEPFLKLLPGGKYGNFFNEMIQFFYYIQLMEDSSDVERKIITEFIKISDIIDFMRAIGYFPSEYEAKNLINEITRKKESRSNPQTIISFTDLIKLYFNHRPVDGYRFNKILESLSFFFNGKLRFEIDKREIYSINRSQILDIMTTKGENISEIQAMRYLLELLDIEDRNIKRKTNDLSDVQIMRNFKKLSNEINIETFCYKVFGMESIEAEKIKNTFERVNKIEKDKINVNDELNEDTYNRIGSKIDDLNSE